jgi:hypothetical protein
MQFNVPVILEETSQALSFSKQRSIGTVSLDGDGSYDLLQGRWLHLLSSVLDMGEEAMTEAAFHSISIIFSKDSPLLGSWKQLVVEPVFPSTTLHLAYY